MKFYIATNYENWKAAKSLKELLELRGHLVTSRWIAMAEARNGAREDQGNDISEEEKSSRAARDFEDVDRAHALVLLTTGRKQPGAMAELGFAIGRGKLSIVVGLLDHLFHRYPGVVNFQTDGEFVEWAWNLNREEILSE